MWAMSTISSAPTSSAILRKAGVTSQTAAESMTYQNAVQYVYIGSNVASISAAFQNCYSLASVAIPDGVTSISASAFQNCYSLASIIIPDGVTFIGGSAFRNCVSLAFVKFEGDTPATADSSTTFTGISTDCIIYIPSGSLEDYEDATNYPDPDVYQYVEY